MEPSKRKRGVGSIDSIYLNIFLFLCLSEEGESLCVCLITSS